jgi:thymidylate synthase
MAMLAYSNLIILPVGSEYGWGCHKYLVLMVYMHVYKENSAKMKLKQYVDPSTPNKEKKPWVN